MEIDRNLLERKLLALEEYIREIKELQGHALEEFLKDGKLQDLAERRLETAIQCSIDIANHIISRLSLGQPEEYSESFEILGAKNIIPEDFSLILSDMAKFRNVLVHLYDKIDEARVHKAVEDGVKDIIKYAQSIRQFMKEHKEL
ncbi:MAG: DUF86 domain-containing protein [Candidatus Margulisiibacteriota bacterium]